MFAVYLKDSTNTKNVKNGWLTSEVWIKEIKLPVQC